MNKLNTNQIFEYLVNVFRNDDLSQINRSWRKIKGREKLYVTHPVAKGIIKVICHTGNIHIINVTYIQDRNRPLELTPMQKEDIQILATAFYYKHYGSK